MKKYVKPDVVFEGFELSRHIAGTCGVIINLSTVNTCHSVEGGTLDMDAVGLFMPGTTCTVDGTGFDAYCYYNHEGLGLMNS